MRFRTSISEREVPLREGAGLLVGETGVKREPMRLARASGEGRMDQRDWRMATMVAASPVYSTGV